jgi:putative cell wall-binding protein
MALDTMNTTSWWNVKTVSSDEGLTYWKRIAGDDRYGTMKKIVQATYNVSGDDWYNASVAVVASGENFPDALAANGLAGALNNGDGAPVILTKKGSLSSQAKELLKNMRVQTVYIMGGTSAISAETEQQIKDLKIATVRVAGADRQATSVEAFKLIDGNWFKNHGTHSVIIATGANYADALSIAPFAYKTGTPVVLTKADGNLTDEAIKAIKDNDEIWQVIVVGGTAVVSDSVFSALGTYSGKYKDYYNKVYVPVRIAGADRYDTSAQIADWEINYALDPNSGYWNRAGFSYAETFVATGENFPDALAGGQLAGGKYYASDKYRNGTIEYKPSSPILLTKDGNRAADSVISANLAWNRNTLAVDAYYMYDGTFAAYLDDLLDWGISRGVWEDGAHGFFTNSLLIDVEAELPETYEDEDGNLWVISKDGKHIEIYDNEGDVIEIGVNEGTEDTVTADLLAPGAWIDGSRLEKNNFRGYIFGGKAAVSKDKAKQLDDTVDAAIRKVYDPVADTGYETVTIGGKTYNTLSYLMANCRRHTVLGVDEDSYISNYYYNNSVVAIQKNDFDYLFQPIDFTTKYTKWDENTGKGIEEVSVINFAVFDRTATIAKNVYDNSYSGYGLIGYKTLVVTAKAADNWVPTAEWVDVI